jgi:hypothetical protein
MCRAYHGAIETVTTDLAFIGALWGERVRFTVSLSST